MDNFDELLEKFDSTLRKYNLDNYSKLKPALSAQEVDTRLDSLGIKNDKIKSLFSWKNGFDVDQNIDTLCQIFKFGTLLSLDSIISLVEANKAHSRWDNFLLIPLVTDSTGQYILFNNEQNTNYGNLYLYSASLLAAIDTIGYYDSLDTMIETTIKAYESGVLSYDEKESWLHVKNSKYREIATELNKNSEYWKLK